MSDLRFLVLTPDGEIADRTLADAAASTTLDELYKTINCNSVDVVRLGVAEDAASMFVDADGMNIELPMINEYATIVTYAFNKEVHQHYFGTAVFLGVPTESGEESSISAGAEAMVREVVAKAKAFGDIVRFLLGGAL